VFQDRRLRELGAGQAGVVSRRQAGVLSRRQALDSGLTDEAIDVRLRSGRWRRLHPGVYATFSGPVPRGARRWAAVLYAGDGAILSHQTAAELVGLTGHRTDTAGSAAEVHVTIPAHRRVKSTSGVVVHRSRRATVAAHPARRPPQTRVEETVLDLAQSAATLDDVAGGCHSLLELRYLRDVERRHGLPVGRRQRRRDRQGGRWYDDVGYEEYRTAVELDGRVAHPDERRWRDQHRDNAGVTEGLSVLRYGTAGVTERPCEVAVQVATVLLRNGWPGPPVPCGPGCPVNTLLAPTASRVGLRVGA
jgi:very-short-patch-repair endonuclease